MRHDGGASSASAAGSRIILVPAAAAVIVAAVVTSLTYLLTFSLKKKRGPPDGESDDVRGPLSSTLSNTHPAISRGGYESLIGNTPLLYLPHISSMLPNRAKIFVKMECMNPGGTGKDRAARSMVLDAEKRGELPPPLARNDDIDDDSRHQRINIGVSKNNRISDGDELKKNTPQLYDRIHDNQNPSTSSSALFNIPSNVHDAILKALHNTQTHGIIIEGTSGSTGISLASLSCSRGHATIVVMPDDQSKQKVDLLKRLGCGVVVVQNCSISNPSHYVNMARRVWEWLQEERRYDAYYWDNVLCKRNGHANGNRTVGDGNARPPKLIQAAFMNQFENLANVRSHYLTTGPEIYSQLDGKVDAFVMSAGTGGTLVGVGGYLKERWWHDCHAGRRDVSSQSPVKFSHSSPRIVLVDPPGSSLYNKVKYGVAYALQQSEQTLRRHRYDTLAEGIGLDRITANFGLGCDAIVWGGRKAAFGDRIAMLANDDDYARCLDDALPSTFDRQSKIIDDALFVTDQQAVDMAHLLLRREGLFVGSSTAINLVGALAVASTMPPGSNVVTVVCDGGQRHVGRFWNRDFVVKERRLVWPGDRDNTVEDAGIGTKNDLNSLGINLKGVQ